MRLIYGKKIKTAEIPFKVIRREVLVYWMGGAESVVTEYLAFNIGKLSIIRRIFKANTYLWLSS